jgi:hypothetical protein
MQIKIGRQNRFPIEPLPTGAIEPSLQLYLHSQLIYHYVFSHWKLSALHFGPEGAKGIHHEGTKGTKGVRRCKGGWNRRLRLMDADVGNGGRDSGRHEVRLARSDGSEAAMIF